MTALEERLLNSTEEPCLFLPSLAEFGHFILTHVRQVFFHNSRERIICCRPGEEVWFPSRHSDQKTRFFTDWVDPIPDHRRAGSIRAAVAWPHIQKMFPNHHPVVAGNLTMEEEWMEIFADQQIPYAPKRRGLHVDVVLGIRQREYMPIKNWQHWQWLTDKLRAKGLTVGVVGRKETAFVPEGVEAFSGDYKDSDAGIEMIQNCRLYCGSDTGVSHMAASLNANMVVFRCPQGGRDFIPIMQAQNKNRTYEVMDGWDSPSSVLAAITDFLQTDEEIGNETTTDHL